jgi:adenine-specific DNA-methyltransferase
VPSNDRPHWITWSERLGLAPFPLFHGSDNDARHYVLLNGVAGSFILSEGARPTAIEAASWAWSSYVRHHVTIEGESVIVTPTAAPQKVERFPVNAVASSLESFLSYLERDNRTPPQSIIDHISNSFIAHCAELDKRNIGRDTQLRSFLAILAATSDLGVLSAITSPDVIATEAHVRHTDIFGQMDATIHDALTSDHVRRISLDLFRPRMVDFQVFLDLAIRHAGGLIFQDAHSHISSSNQMELFGLPSVTRVFPSGTGVYFTPPGIARVISEIVLRPYLDRDEISIFDPACGSGVFLSEAARALRRFGYGGRIKLQGVDISPFAVAMARFTLATLGREWPDARLTIDVTEGNYLTDWGTERPLVILMNPPFKSWEDMGDSERTSVRAHLGGDYRGRPDMSMVFISNALKSLSTDGTLGTLLPIGVLASQSAEKWRSSLLEQAQPELIASFGNHALFRFAMVNPGALVLRKRAPIENSSVLFTWAAEKRSASSDALRHLRMLEADATVNPAREKDWAIYLTSFSALRRRRDWIPRPNSLGTFGDQIEATTPTIVSDLFSIRQGVRTGRRSAFILSDEQLSQLPPDERIHFRRMLDGDDIKEGAVESRKWIFYPTQPFSSADELRERVPTYVARYIDPQSEELQARAGVSDLWRPTRPRGYFTPGIPRIVSKMFGRTNSFAFDATGEYVVVQGYAWFPTAQRISRMSDSDIETTLRIYTWILNSDIFVALVRERSVSTSGGQWDLGSKYVSSVPLPNLFAGHTMSPGFQEKISQLLAEERQPSAFALNEIAALAYHTDLTEWPI